MNSLSDYVLTMLIHRSSLAGMLHSTLQTKSYRLKRHMRVVEVRWCMNKYQGLQHISLPSWQDLSKLSDEVMENLLSIRISSPMMEVTISSLPEMKRCKKLQSIRLHRDYTVPLADLDSLYLPPTLTELRCTFTVSSLEEARWCISDVTLPCPIVVRCSSHLNLAGRDRLGRVRFNVSTDKTFLPEVFTPTRTRGIEQIPLNDYACSSFTLQRIVTHGLTEDWLSVINSLPHLLHVTITGAIAPDELYAITAKITSLVILLRVTSKLMIGKLPSTLKRLEVKGNSVFGRSSYLYFSPTTDIQAPHVSKTPSSLCTLIAEESVVCSPLPVSLQGLEVGEIQDMNYLSNCVELRKLQCRVREDVSSWPESLTDLTVFTDENRPITLPSRLPRRLKHLEVHTVRPTEEMLNWSLSGLRTVCVNYALILDQLNSFNGHSLRSHNKDDDLRSLRASAQRRRSITSTKTD